MKKLKFKGERTASTIKIASGMVIFLATVCLDVPIASTAIVALISVLAVREFIRAFGAQSRLLTAVSCAVSALIVCWVGYVSAGGEKLPELDFVKTVSIAGFYVIIMLMLTVIFHEKIRYRDTVAAVFATIAISYSLSCFLMLAEIDHFVSGVSHYEGIYLVFMVFGVSWLTDVFAFLVGRKLGKHKLCPKISPKKSIEGAVGGTVIMTVFILFVSFVFDLVSGKLGYEYFIHPSALKYLFIAGFAIILSIISMFGDLAASVLKRNAGIKDFSNILPGHGGIIDRFDSTLFVLPVMFGMIILVMG